MNVGRSIDALTSASVASFLALEPTFNNSAFSDTYSPWNRLDQFGRANMLASFNSVGSRRRAETKKVRFGILKSSSDSKRLPPSGLKRSYTKRQSDSELPMSSNTSFSDKDLE